MPLAVPTMIIFMGGPYTTLNHAPSHDRFRIGLPALLHVSILHHFFVLRPLWDWHIFHPFHLLLLLYTSFFPYNLSMEIDDTFYLSIPSTPSVLSILSILSISSTISPSFTTTLFSWKTPVPCSAESNSSSKAPLGYQALQRTQGGKIGRILCLIQTLLI